MNAFDDGLRSLMTARDDLAERVRDEFGMSVLTDVFEPMLTESHGLAQLWDESQETILEVDLILEEVRSMGDGCVDQ